MRTVYNVRALTSQNALKANDQKFSNATVRLSTGKKINSSKESPAGLALSRRINSQIQSMKQSTNNTSDGVNIVQTIDGVLGEVQAMLQRMNELAVKASTDTLQSEDRAYIQKEISNLKSEIQRVSKTTQFNGQPLLDGTFDKKGYATIGGATDKDISIATYSDGLAAGKYTISGLAVDLMSDNDQRNDAYEDGAKQLDPKTLDYSALDVRDEKGNSIIKPGQTGVNVSITGNQISIRNDKGDSITLQANRKLTASEDITADLTDAGPLRMQQGVNEGQTVDLKIPAISLMNLGIRFTDCSNADWAREGIGEIKGAIDFVSRLRSDLGAVQNRMEHRMKSLGVNEENMTSAYSNIMDADMAKEMTEYSSLQVMNQAEISMLAQANQRPDQILQMLGN